MKNCPYCGKELADDESCTCPGASADTAAAQAVPQDAAQVAPTSFVDKVNELWKTKKILCLAVLAGVIVLLLLIAIIAGSAGGSYMDPINGVVKEINKGVKADYVELSYGYSPDFFRDATGKISKVFPDIDEIIEDQQDDLAEDFEDLKDQYGKWKLRFVKTDAEKLSKSDLKDYREIFEDLWDDRFEDIVDKIDDFDSDDLEDFADLADMEVKDFKKMVSYVKDYYKSFKKVKISEGYKVKGYYELKDGREEIDKTDKLTLYVLKINGDWTVYESKNDETFRFDREAKHYDDYSFLHKYLNGFYSDMIGSVDFF